MGCIGQQRMHIRNIYFLQNDPDDLGTHSSSKGFFRGLWTVLVF